MVGMVVYAYSVTTRREVEVGLRSFNSLVLTLAICFVLPALGLGIALGTLTLGVCSPLAAISAVGRDGLLDFLLTFGAGNVGWGIVVICLTLSIVGGLFEVFALYKCQHLSR
ncbi:MAG: hypothetical protein AAGI45_20965 [Cyanobacteria bacterium P01_H01_bin.26]